MRSCEKYTKAIALGAALVAACAPQLDPPAWLVTGPAVLAIASDPPEVAAGGKASFSVLAVSTSGPIDPASSSWAVCRTPLALTEPGSIAPECLGDLPPAGQGAPTLIATSSDGCALFGPIGATTGSSTSPRPRQPDATGGYYQPIRLELDSQTAFAQQRLLCPLVQAPFNLSIAFQASYQANQNPIITSLAAIAPDGSQLDPAAIPANTKLALSLQWDKSSNEIFPVYDLASLQLVPTQETMHVSWFTTAGALELATSGADSSGLASVNFWTTPAAAGPVFVWAVLRDSRGGQSWSTFAAKVVTARTPGESGAAPRGQP